MFIPYPKKIKDNILHTTYFPKKFGNEYGESHFGDEGFITPLGIILHCGGSNHHYVIRDILTDDYIEELSHYIKNRTIDDIIENEDDSVLIADALDHGFIRFSVDEDKFCEIGKKIAYKSLDLLYDFVDYVCKDNYNFELDLKNDFKFILSFNNGLDENGNNIYSKNVIRYNSLDEFDKKFINDIKRNVQII